MKGMSSMNLFLYIQNLGSSSFSENIRNLYKELIKFQEMIKVYFTLERILALFKIKRLILFLQDLYLEIFMKRIIYMKM